MRLLFAVLVCVGAVGTLSAQTCTTNPLYADSTFGTWPDTTTNFPHAEVNVYYETVLDIKLPINAQDINPSLPSLVIDSATVTNVVGLPAGVTYVCNDPLCTWLGDSQGCAVLYGTPTTIGTYELTIEMTGYGTFGTVVISQSEDFGGYRLVVGPKVGIAELDNGSFQMTELAPNPANDKIQISFYSSRHERYTIRILNLLGEKMDEFSVVADQGENTITQNIEKYSPGIYFFTLSNGVDTSTKRLLVQQ